MSDADFAEPLRVTQILERFDKPWFVAGGWAIDLFQEQVTRPHADLEIAILRSDQFALRRYLTDWHFKQAIPSCKGGGELLWQENEWLELPVHELHAQLDNQPESAIEILLNEASETDWIFRRNFEIQRPLALMGLRSKLGVPFLSPEIVLLYKARNPRLKDKLDFQQVYGHLETESRCWLREAIARCYPQHPWLLHLDEPPAL
jgi:hypothetical protein